MSKNGQSSTFERGEVTLYSEPTPGLTENRRELVLWNILNDKLADIPALEIKTHDEEGKLKPVEWRFNQHIEWDEWQHVCLPRLEYAAKLNIPHLPELLPHTGRAAIVGAGPSVKDFVEDIKKFKEYEFNNVLSVNATHNWLIEQGVPPIIHVISEHDVDDVELSLGGPPHKDVYYYIASCCDKRIFQQLEGYHRVLWHQFLPPQGYQQGVHKNFRGEFMVGGGYATFFRSVSIAIVLGYRNFDLFGCDSSFEDSSHMDGYEVANREPKITIWGCGPDGKTKRKFTTQGGLAFQVKEFLEFCKYNHDALRIKVHGDGLLRYVHESRYPEQYRT